MSDLKWVDQPAVIEVDAPATALMAAAKKSQAILIRDSDGRYYAYETAVLRILPWFAKLSRLRTGKVADYVNLAFETPADVSEEGQQLPADFRKLVETGKDGSPLRVALPEIRPSELAATSDFVVPFGPGGGYRSGVAKINGGARPPETVSVVRYPVIETSTVLAPGIEVDFTIDLPSVPPSGVPDPDTISISGLPADWQEAEIATEIASGQIEFRKSTDTIVLHRDGTSLACTLHGTVSAACTPGQKISVVVTFLLQDRVCGFMRRTFTLGQPPAIPPGVPMGLDLDGLPPVLTVMIFKIEPEQSGRFLWSALIPRGLDIAGLPGELKGEINLGSDAASFVRTEFPKLAGLKPGEHMISFHGFGDLLWRKAPAFFQQTYWALRKALGDNFAIQFISDDPNIPWELMRPASGDENAETELLSMTHPVARCLGESQGSLRYHLPAGKIATIAPNYEKANDRLERAQIETKMLQSQYAAVPVVGTFKGVWDLLTKGLGPGPLSIVHFAGHGNFSLDSAAESGLKLQDRTLTVLQVGAREVRLGKKSRCLVVFNACDTGSTGSLLGSPGGWADTILQQGFGGFIAPLWAVDDSDAGAVAADLFDDVVNQKLPVAQAMLAIRKQYGTRSPTYLAYLFYGDVGAKIDG